MLAYALARLRTRRGRTTLAGAGVFAAAAMVGAAVTAGYGLASGFDRAAERAGLPDAIARFDAVDRAQAEARTAGLANVRALAFRLEVSGRHVSAGNDSSDHATLVGVADGLHGYGVVAGSDLSARPGEVVVERGLARAWHLGPGSTVTVEDPAGIERAVRVVGEAVAPDTVAFPLAKGPRLWLRYEDVVRLAGARPGTVDEALLWARDPSALDATLAQARAASYGLAGLQFVTRSGVRVLVGRAAGIVIALLSAFSVIAVGAAGIMLAAAAAAEVQRRLEAIGLLRAVGASVREVTAAHALEAGVLAALPAASGLAAGWAAVAGPLDGVLGSLNELPPGAAVLPLLVGAFAAIVALVAVASALPAWRAASRPAVEALRGGDVAGAARRAPLPRGVGGLGVRLVLARPVRAAATTAVLASSGAVVLLILAIAALLANLQRSPQAVGKRYALTVDAPASARAAIARTPGVAGVAPRYETEAADSFQLGESFQIVAFPGDHTRWEAPPLAAGRRLAANGEAEVGLGLAEALGLHPGATLAVQLPGGEARFRVAGIVRALGNEGRIAYVRPPRLLLGDPGLAPQIAVRLDPGASADAVTAALAAHGFYASGAGGVAGSSVQGWAERSSGFLDVLVALLRSIALLDGLVCVYVLAQMLALTAHDRRRAVALIRATGASRAQVNAVFATAALAVGLAAAPAAVALERLLVGPLVSRLAASYVSLSLRAGWVEVAVVVAGILVAALAAAAWVARAAVARPIVSGLREE